MYQRRNNGLTFVETLMTLTISTMLVAILSAWYIQHQKYYQRQNELAKFQNHLRMVSFFFNDALHSAGNLSCAKDTSNWVFPFKNKSQKINSDGFTTYSVGESTPLMRDMKRFNFFYINSRFRVSPGSYVVIDDCQQFALIQIKKILYLTRNMQRIETVLPLKKLYLQNSQINLFEVKHFFIAQNNLAKSKYSLFEITQNQKSKAVVDDVDDLQIFYLVRDQNNVLQKLSSADFQSNTNVVAMIFYVTIKVNSISKRVPMYVALSK